MCLRWKNEISVVADCNLTFDSIPHSAWLLFQVLLRLHLMASSVDCWFSTLRSFAFGFGLMLEIT